MAIDKTTQGFVTNIRRFAAELANVVNSELVDEPSLIGAVDKLDSEMSGLNMWDPQFRVKDDNVRHYLVHIFPYIKYERGDRRPRIVRIQEGVGQFRTCLIEGRLLRRLNEAAREWFETHEQETEEIKRLREELKAIGEEIHLLTRTIGRTQTGKDRIREEQESHRSVAGRLRIAERDAREKRHEITLEEAQRAVAIIDMIPVGHDPIEGTALHGLTFEVGPLARRVIDESREASAEAMINGPAGDIEEEVKPKRKRASRARRKAEEEELVEA